MDPDDKVRFEGEVQKKEDRKIRARQHPGRSIWFGLGMIGLVGWSVALPTLIGVAIGLWIDSWAQSRYSWTLTFLLIGVAIGCWNAWYWVKRQGGEE